MTSREQQREATRTRILNAAIEVFTKKGFHGASTRDIASLASTNQGLITYHFSSKEALWQAAANSLFEALDDRLRQRLSALDPSDKRAYMKESIREYVRFVAECPAFFRLMVDEGRIADDRMNWLVDTHIKPRFMIISARLRETANFKEELLPHVFYTMAGAASLIFAVAPECRRLTGLDPQTASAVEMHAEFISNLLLPSID